MAAKVCVVFGVGPGMGMSCVRKWAKEGFKVAMVSRTESKLKDLAAKNPGLWVLQNWRQHLVNGYLLHHEFHIY